MKELRFLFCLTLTLFCLTLTLTCLLPVFPWLLVPAVVSAAGLVAVGRGERDAWLRRRYSNAQNPATQTIREQISYEQIRDRQAVRARERKRTQRIQTQMKTLPYQLVTEDGHLIPCACEAWTSVHTHTASPRTIVTFDGQLRKARTAPVNPAEMTAAQRQLFTALTQAPVKPKPPVLACTEGGPCRAVDREIIRDAAGNRVASRCGRCERERYWLPFIQNGEV